MSRLNSVLLLILVLSAVALVNASYQTRRLFAELDEARAEERQLASDTVRLQAEARHEATHLKVESAARARLQMHLATSNDTLYLVDATASGAAR